jgi:hypothetical protein
MQLIPVANLLAALQEYMDPDNSGILAEEIGVYYALLTQELAKVPNVNFVLFWDDDEGGDPELNLHSDQYVKRELVPTPVRERGVFIGTEQSPGAVFNARGDSYYGATFYQRNWFPVGQFVISLWFGGCPLASAGGFKVIPVA